MPIELMLGVFAATFGLVAVAGLLLDTEQGRARRAAIARLERRGEGAQAVEAVNLLRRAQRLSAIGVLERLLSGRALTWRLLALLDRAGVLRPPGEVVLLATACAAGAFTAALYTIGAAAGAVLAVAGGALPFWVLGRMAAARARQYEAQLPDALDAIVNALKAGYSFPAALDYVAGELSAPLGPELARARDEQRLGVDARAVLTALADRVGTTDARMFVTAVLLQRETGGNLAELLANLAMLVRERAQFRGRVAALTAEPRLSALVLALMPIAVLLLLLFVNPDYVRPLTTTTTGRGLLTFAGVACTLGYAVMRRIGAVEL